MKEAVGETRQTGLLAARAGPGMVREEMFARHVGTQVGYLTERGAEIVFLSSSRPHKLNGPSGIIP